MKNKTIIIIGAGLGGLSAAAYLLKAGYKPIIIEKTSYPGGRCYIRNIHGRDFNIGALYIGEKAPEILKEYFNINFSFEYFRIGVKVGNQYISIPFDYIALKELRKSGISLLNLIKFFIKTPGLFGSRLFEKYKSVGELINYLTNEELIRKLGYILFGVLGLSPYRIPSHFMKMGLNTDGPIVGNPVHILGGNRKIADHLVDYILKLGGTIKFEEEVQKIIINKNIARSIVTNKNEYETDFVISNTDIKTTVLKLIGSNELPPDYIKRIIKIKKPMQVISIFLIISKKQNFPENHEIFFKAENPIENFEMLENGIYVEKPMFVVQIPSILDNDGGDHYATLQFYAPRGELDIKSIMKQVEWILSEGMDQIIPGLSKNIITYSVYDPIKYENEFGLKPYVYGLSPDIDNPRFLRQTPISNIFCVGDSVKPDRPSVPQVLQSGIYCAQEIVG
jgi:phytoene dehydrogenase-like protein